MERRGFKLFRELGVCAFREGSNRPVTAYRLLWKQHGIWTSDLGAGCGDVVC